MSNIFFIFLLFWPFIWFGLGAIIFVNINKYNQNFQIIIYYVPHLITWALAVFSIIFYNSIYEETVISNFSIYYLILGFLIGLLLSLLLNRDFPSISTIIDLFKKKSIIAIVYVMTSTAEEIIWRLYFFNIINHEFWDSILISWIVTSIWFSMMHIYQGAYGLMNQLITGLVFGGLYIFTGDIFSSIIAHISYNLVIFANKLEKE